MLDEKWMRMALAEAEEAARMGEVPVGAVLVKDGEILAKTHNLCENLHDATAHAELLAISEACRKNGHWRLSACTLYVTLEPCPMCMGAAINARIPRIVYAAKDARAGACGSLIDLTSYPLEARPHCESGLMCAESQSLLKDFFARMREKIKNK